MPLKYPSEFAQRVKSEFHSDSSICSAVDSGLYILGKFLAKEASRQMPPEDIVAAFSNARQEKILLNAKAVIRRRALHIDWLRIMSKKISSLDDELKK